MILSWMAPEARVAHGDARFVEVARRGLLLNLLCVVVFDLALIPL